MRWAAWALLASSAAAAVVDRIAVVVADSVLTETEVLEEVRIVQFLNGDPLETGPAAKRAAAERLVDQQLIRGEMSVGSYPEPEPSQAEEMLKRLKDTRFRSEAEYRAALEHYGIAEEQVKRHLLWQLAVIRFTDLRFRAGLPPPPVPGSSGEASRSTGNGTLAATVDERLDKWLKETRARTRIVLKEEAFE
jgi:hypothetical protein